ncbi:XRE family transcriptional regulator [Corynebacterium cystitidis]|uniref:Zn-dependent peptidase ImmA, M78 family n=1 Tax=Corynebacterium cystitidis DSM 20524 TaxID=1121357 RepID=A0A1H9UWL2_9CORY|nr:XRE family transcriptional regulator [Corynebacterium cystitidis]WJY83664.1 Helix-turn-helix protein [Corynebacterium cystitidis DSM 20524]SES13940.1 Zn-dependent peptidase ImmA, M78 family [Corynebacterium cystitidis DSM 20524]SNV91446.1 transcriptional regulator [Corynebacterium cystitidis]
MSISTSKRHRDWLVEPTRITVARRRRGMTKTSLAKELDVTTRTVTRYENDGAPCDAAQRLSSVLNFPEDYFFLDPPALIERDDLAFRSAARTSAAVKEAAVASASHGVDFHQWLNKHIKSPPPSVTFLGNMSPEEAAGQLRHEWGLGTDPLPNLVQLAESHGVRVFGIPALADSVDAFSMYYEGQPYIFLTRRRTPEGVRFDIAHELGHLVMHSRGADYAAGKEEEREADRFAAEFLMPTASISNYMPQDPTEERLFELKRFYGVSAMAMAVKAKTTGKLTQWSYRSVRRRLISGGFDKGEPGGLSSYEQSRVFQFLFSPARTQRWTPATVAKDLCIPVEDLQSLTLNTVLGAVPAAKQESSYTVDPEEHSRPQLRIVKS